MLGIKLEQIFSEMYQDGLVIRETKKGIHEAIFFNSPETIHELTSDDLAKILAFQTTQFVYDIKEFKFNGKEKAKYYYLTNSKMVNEILQYEVKGLQSVDSLSDEEAKQIIEKVLPVIQKIGHKGLFDIMKYGMFVDADYPSAQRIGNNQLALGVISNALIDFDKHIAE